MELFILLFPSVHLPPFQFALISCLIYRFIYLHCIASNELILVNNELERMWNEGIMT
jgi:hypothetical protein